MFVSRAETKDPDASVAEDLGVPVSFVKQLKHALESTFKDHVVGLTHVAAFVFNYADMPEFRPFVDWVKQRKPMIIRSFRLPKYIVKALEQMSSGGCSPILHGRVVKFSGQMCFEVLLAITAVLLYVVRVYARHGVWVVLEEGAGVGDVHVVFKGENNVQ